MEDKSRRIIFTDNTSGRIKLPVEEDCWKVLALGLMQSGYLVGMKGEGARVILTIEGGE